ncbi:MAG: nickel pincer cofactor biosynthesis protein LarC [Caldisericia bacterium]|jgi:uncharacterized protein (TIGR00299 family) protein|nr:nickel pincer cofactor biosynthesis protein LarC [Caldisericia bacterium]
MNIAYFDLVNGVSGDMIIGSLLDAGLSLSDLKEEINKLNLKGFDLEANKKEKKGIFGTKFDIKIYEKEEERKGVDLIKIVEKSSLKESVKEKSIKILERLIDAEAKIHNEDKSSVHLHEIGGIDTIIDVVGSVVGIEILNIEKIYSSPVPVGSGFVKISHGVFPVPTPATLELLKGVPIYSNGVIGEITTPTGAAIITTLAETFGDVPLMRIEKIGYGLGEKDFDIPNILRIFVGELKEDYLKDYNILIETNIDDMNPQIFGFIMEKAFSLGALDLFFTPIYMKKNRPAYKISILCEEKDKSDLIDFIFRETSSIGVRINKVEKIFLKREIKEIDTEFGKIRVKISYFGDNKKITPEYEDIKRIAEEKNLPLNKVYSQIEKIINKLFF